MKINLLNNIPAKYRKQISLRANRGCTKYIMAIASSIFFLSAILILSLMTFTDRDSMHYPLVSMIIMGLMLFNITVMVSSICICRYITNKNIKNESYKLGVYPIKCWHCNYLIRSPATRYCPECGAPLVGENTVQK